MLRNFLPSKKIKNLPLIFLATILFSLIFSSIGCPVFKHRSPFECSLVDLKENSSTGYYDAEVRMERITLKDPLKSRFAVVTLTTSILVEDLTFIEEGKDPSRLEKGDVLVVPLNKPDWKLSIMEQDEVYCSLIFWNELPERDQWHPLKSEAMEVARNIEVAILGGTMRPVVGNLPEEWEKSEEKLPESDSPCGEVLYQKIRADEVEEEVFISYCPLTEEDRVQLDTFSTTEFLKGWTDWTKKYGKPEETAGHAAISWDMQGMGPYGWSYRYLYIDNELVIEVSIDSDPLEWAKSSEEKRLEEKSRQIFFRYGYGPVGEPGWQVMIEVRRNGEGTFHKRSRDGITIEKEFLLSEEELNDIEKALAENNFAELSSRSGLPGGITSFISVRYADKTHTVQMKNVKVSNYQNIEKIIRATVLPKVEEK